MNQATKATADQSEKRALPILLDIQAYTKQGNTLPFSSCDNAIQQLDNGLQVLYEDKGEYRFTLNTIESATVSCLANFSSPINVLFDYSHDDLIAIALNDKDAFNRWDATQRLYSMAVTQCLERPEQDLDWLHPMLSSLLKHAQDSREESAEYLTVPSIESLIQERKGVEIIALCNAREALCKKIANQHQSELIHHYQLLEHRPYVYEQRQVNTRRLRKSLLSLLAYLPESKAIIESLYHTSDNMTDTLSALVAAQQCNTELFANLMTDFEQKWRNDSLVIDKWFGLHAISTRADILPQLTLLQQHPRFSPDNPNRVRALIGSFGFYNKEAFHKLDGSGYKFLTDYLLELDGKNPQVASRMVTPLTQFQNLAVCHQTLMKEQLGRLLNHKSLSKDVFEKVSKALAYESEK